MKKNYSLSKALPILFGFFIMGFCDLVGVSTSYLKDMFGLSEKMAGFIPSMVFIWFLIFSLPTAALMNKIGRKNTVLLSFIVTIVGMFIPLFFPTDFPAYMIAFILLGIGNTILQVSLNPLLTNVVKGDALMSSLSVGQVVKAVCSLLGPVIAVFSASQLGNWMFIFPLFAVVTIGSSIWLILTRIPSEEPSSEVASMRTSFGLLKNKRVLSLFLGIVFVVGTDVGMNTVAPKLLHERCGFDIQTAGVGSSIYFLCRTVGAVIGAVLLAKMSSVKYFRMHILLALMGMVALFFAHTPWMVFSLIGVLGYAISCVFPVIFGKAIMTRPDKTNDISGLMITGVFGGAVVPPLMGFATEHVGSQAGSLLVITACVCYLTYLSFNLKMVHK